MSNQQAPCEQEWELDSPCEIADDSLGDTDYPESEFSSDEEENVHRRTKAYRNRHTGYLYCQRNPSCLYEKFENEEEEISKNDQDLSDWTNEEEVSIANTKAATSTRAVVMKRMLIWKKNSS
jgi:hypothetical protein